MADKSNIQTQIENIISDIILFFKRFVKTFYDSFTKSYWDISVNFQHMDSDYISANVYSLLCLIIFYSLTGEITETELDKMTQAYYVKLKDFSLIHELLSSIPTIICFYTIVYISIFFSKKDSREYYKNFAKYIISSFLVLYTIIIFCVLFFMEIILFFYNPENFGAIDNIVSEIIDVIIKFTLNYHPEMLAVICLVICFSKVFKYLKKNKSKRYILLLYPILLSGSYLIILNFNVIENKVVNAKTSEYDFYIGNNIYTEKPLDFILRRSDSSNSNYLDLNCFITNKTNEIMIIDCKNREILFIDRLANERITSEYEFNIPFSIVGISDSTEFIFIKPKETRDFHFQTSAKQSDLHRKLYSEQDGGMNVRLFLKYTTSQTHKRPDYHSVFVSIWE